MQQRLAYGLSVLFHPGLIPTFAFWLLLYRFDPLVVVGDQARVPLLLLVFFGTFLVPMLMVYVLKRGGQVSSLSLEEQSERPLPFLITAVFYAFFTFLFFERTYFDQLLAFILAGITVSVLLAAFITRIYKISMHSLGLGGLVGALFALQLRYGHWIGFQEGLLFGLVASGLVMTARLYMQAHTPGQVWLGWTLSALINFGTMQVYFALVD